jgi:hypothetical protein
MTYQPCSHPWPLWHPLAGPAIAPCARGALRHQVEQSLHVLSEARPHCQELVWSEGCIAAALRCFSKVAPTHGVSSDSPLRYFHSQSMSSFGASDGHNPPTLGGVKPPPTVGAPGPGFVMLWSPFSFASRMALALGKKVPSNVITFSDQTHKSPAGPHHPPSAPVREACLLPEQPPWLLAPPTCKGANNPAACTHA